MNNLVKMVLTLSCEEPNRDVATVLGCESCPTKKNSIRRARIEIKFSISSCC